MSYVHNSRNEAIHLRSLLSKVCRVIERYYPDLMPRDVRIWWATQKHLARKTTDGSADVSKLMDDLKEVENDSIHGDVR